ncbi:MAG: hypothetical protein NC429_17475 [Lachnospiraceae bacterium]|nr:hypothetical protein [Lachnospiraceae bacterium]
MKYIAINIKSFIKNETAIFALVILCILSSAVIINFVFGFYHHLQEKKLEGEMDSKSFGIYFYDETRTIVTKGSLMETLLSLDDGIYEDCTIRLDGRFLGEESQYPGIDNGLLIAHMFFGIQDGKATVAPAGETMREGNVLVDGDYFTAEQIENGELVCLALREGTRFSGSNGEQEKWSEKYSPNADGTYTVNGKNYTCIGHIDWISVVPWVPVTTVADDCYIKQAWFSYKKTVPRRAYKEITNIVKNKYGDLAEVEALDFQEVDSVKFYNTLLVLCILLISMSGLTLSVLYQYVLLQRRKQLTIYRMCGLTNKKAKLLYFVECLFISTVIYLLAVVLFHFAILPYLCRFFEYIAASYTLYSYTVLGLLYVGISSLILYLMIQRQMGWNISDELREV